MRRMCGALGAALILLPAASASAEISQRYAPADGTPVLIDPVREGSTVEWRRCAPDCSDVVATGTVYNAGVTASGTRFRADITFEDRNLTEYSAVWQGGPVATTAPALSDTPAVGQRLELTDGTWSGGWPGSGSSTTVVPGGITATNAPLTRDFFGKTLTPVSVLLAPGQLANETVGGAVGPVSRGATIGPVLWSTPPALPKVGGKLAAGSEVRLVLGTSPDVPSGLLRSALRACPTAQDGQGCVLVGTFRTEFERKVKLPSSKLGWYVGAVEALFLPTWGMSHKALPVAGPTVFFAPLSQAPLGLAFTPNVKLRSTALDLGDGRVQLGTISCHGRCTAYVTVDGGRPQTLGISPGRRRITAPRGRGSSITVKVAFDHSDVVASGRVRLKRR